MLSRNFLWMRDLWISIAQVSAHLTKNIVTRCKTFSQGGPSIAQNIQILLKKKMLQEVKSEAAIKSEQSSYS